MPQLPFQVSFFLTVSGCFRFFNCVCTRAHLLFFLLVSRQRHHLHLDFILPGLCQKVPHGPEAEPLPKALVGIESPRIDVGQREVKRPVEAFILDWRCLLSRRAGLEEGLDDFGTVVEVIADGLLVFRRHVRLHFGVVLLFFTAGSEQKKKVKK